MKNSGKIAKELLDEINEKYLPQFKKVVEELKKRGITYTPK